MKHNNRGIMELPIEVWVEYYNRSGYAGKSIIDILKQDNDRRKRAIGKFIGVRKEVVVI